MLPRQELSSPLEWLLQSPQSTPEALAQAAWEACGASLLRMGEHIFGEKGAETFAALVLADVLEQAAAYRGAEPPCAWVLRLAAARAQAVVPRPQRAEVRRRAACSLLAMGWEREAAALLEVTESCKGAEGEAEPLPMRVPKREAACLQNAAPLPPFHSGTAPGAATPSPGPSPTCVSQAVALAEMRHRRSSRLARLKETLLALFLVAAVLTGLRIGRALDTHHAGTPAATQLVVVEVTATPPPATLAPTPIARYPSNAVFWRVQPGDTLPLLAQRYGVSVSDLLAWNGLDDPNAPLKVGDLIAVRMRFAGTLPGWEEIPTAEPLPANASPEDILERMRNSAVYWRTLWVDAFIAAYGPVGYTGPPRVLRQQVWLTQDGRSLVLEGPEDGPAEVVRRTENGEEVPAAHRLLMEMLFPERLLEPDVPALRLVGWDVSGGRRALRLDVLRPGGLYEVWWVDVRYGFLLRRQVFTRGGALSFDLQVRDLALNFVPEARIFDPEHPPSHFAASPRGDAELPGAKAHYQPLLDPPGHVPMPLPPPLTPRPDFDPAEARLTFQWDSWPSFWDSEGEPVLQTVDVRLFANWYYLGEITGVQVNGMSPCVRSPDGRYLAWLPPSASVVEWATDLRGRGLVLEKDGLRSLELDFRGDDGAAGDTAVPRGWMAFSPEARFLYYAADSEAFGMGIYRLEQDWRDGVTYDSPRRLFHAFHTGPLAVSPSGEQLAWLEYRDTDTWELVLADLKSETVLSRQVVAIRMAEDGLPVSVPSVWGKPFPWPWPGFLNCRGP